MTEFSLATLEKPLIVSNCVEDVASPANSSPHMEYSKVVIITSISADCDIFVHEFCKNVKIKLEALQVHINKLLDKLKW